MAGKVNTKSDNHYLSGKEIRAIAKENRKITAALEKRKHRRAEESEFVTEMKNPENILEIEDLHTYFYTDQGVVKAVNGVSFNVPKKATVGQYRAATGMECLFAALYLTGREARARELFALAYPQEYL